MAKKEKRAPVIALKSVNKTFVYKQGGAKHEEAVLTNITADIYAGEYVMLYGPSGCGKTTLLNIMAGLERPTSGQVEIRGDEYVRMSEEAIARFRNRSIGMCFQQFNLISGMSVLENIALPQVVSGTPLRKRRKRALDLLERVGLDVNPKLPAKNLSGGQQQKIAIARALVNNPWILFFDEPTGNLDSKSGAEIMGIISSLAERSKRTIVLITHNQDYLSDADRVLHMLDGTIVKETESAAKTTGRGKSATETAREFADGLEAFLATIEEEDEEAED